MRATNPREVGLIFREYARKIHAKALPSDPNFIRISIACGKVRCPPPVPVTLITYIPQIESWCEHNYPSFIQIGHTGTQTVDPSDPRGQVVIRQQQLDSSLASKKRIEELRAGVVNGTATKSAVQPLEIGKGELFMYVGAAFAVVMVLTLGVVWALLKYTE